MRLFSGKFKHSTNTESSIVEIQDEDFYKNGPHKSTKHLLLKKLTYHQLQWKEYQIEKYQLVFMRLEVLNKKKRIGRGNIVIFLDESHWEVRFVRGELNNNLIDVLELKN